VTLINNSKVLFLLEQKILICLKIESKEVDIQFIFFLNKNKIESKV